MGTKPPCSNSKEENSKTKPNFSGPQAIPRYPGQAMKFQFIQVLLSGVGTLTIEQSDNRYGILEPVQYFWSAQKQDIDTLLH